MLLCANFFELFSKRRNIIFFFILLFWFIFKIGVYRYVGFPQAVKLSIIVKFLSAGMFLFCIKDILRIKKYKYTSLIAINVILSFLISIFLWDASPYYSVQAQGTSVGLLYIIVYFALRKWKVEKMTVQYVLITLSIIYLLCWGYSLYKMPEMVFGIDRDNNYGEIVEERGFYRLFIPGNISPILSFYFLGIFLNKKKKWGLFLFLVMLLIVILHVGRQIIIWTVIISSIMIFVHYRKSIVYFLFSIILGYISLQFIAEEVPAVSAMIELTDEQGKYFEKDIRVKASKYFIFDYPHNFVTTMLGNGVPAVGSELYRIEQHAVRKGYYQTDVGFIAMYCNYGIITIILFVLLLIKVIRLKVEPNYEYLKYYIYFLYGTYLMSQALTSSIFTLMMAYYVLEKSAKDYKKYKNIADSSINVSNDIIALPN